MRSNPFRSLPFFIAKRYFAGKKHNRTAVNWLSWISILTITTCTAALIIILSVFNGFQDMVERMYRHFYTDLRISPFKGKAIAFTKEQRIFLQGLNEVRAYAPILHSKALLQTRATQIIADIYGIDSVYYDMLALGDIVDRSESAPFLNEMVSGIFGADARGCLLGSGIASALSVTSGAPFTGYFAPRTMRSSLDWENDLRAGDFWLQQVFRIGQADVDNQSVFMDRAQLRHYMLLDTPLVSFIALALKDKHTADRTKETLKVYFPDTAYKVQNYYEQNEQVFSVFTSEKQAIIVILGFIMLVAAFNIASTLSLSVLQKQQSIFILRTLGCSVERVRWIFFYSGAILGMLGVILGLFIGTIVVLLQACFHWIPLRGGSFLIDYFPVQLKFTDYLITIMLTLGISFLATLRAGYRAAKMARTIKGWHSFVQ